jgi:hypothetical protein
MILDGEISGDLSNIRCAQMDKTYSQDSSQNKKQFD